jgi:ElaB/YqjD/DUF883 family membrane-anchored ribosome-binding protein
MASNLLRAAKAHFRCPSCGLHRSNIPSPQEYQQMADIHRMADDAQEAVRDAADQASDKVREFGDKAGETFRKASDKVNQSAKDGLKTARQFAQTAQKYVEDSGIGDVDVREIVNREPWIALGVAFAAGFVVAQIMRRMSK